MSQEFQMGAAAVLTDLESGAEPIDMHGARTRLAHTVKRPDPATVWRWRTRGARAANGQKVVLETAKLGGGIVTTAPAIKRFHERLNGVEGLGQRKADFSQIERDAERRLAAAGL